jgi:hypothetical protein
MMLKKAPGPAAGEKMKLVRLNLPERDHDALRIVAAKAKTSMAGFVRPLVDRAIEPEKKGGKK